ncbi:MAG TPA: ferredoxin, partial [Prolixibacteraceae bacterium]|nr:ferredoxin [Prolixibacteraceae bacterium]
MTIILTIAILSIIGTTSAVILFFVAKKFYVYEDPR